MAEMKKASGKMQLDTEGGLVRATFEMVVESGATKAGLGNEEAPGGFTGEIGVTKAGPGNMEAVWRSAGVIGVTKAGLGNKEAAGRSTGEIGAAKALLWNKDEGRSSTPEIGVTKAVLWNKEAAGSSTPEIGVTKAAAGSSAPKAVLRKASGSSTPEIGFTKAAADSSAPKIGVTKAAAGSSAPEIGVTKAAACISAPENGVTKAAACISAPEIVFTKAAADSSAPGIGFTKAAADSSTPAINMGLAKAWLEKAAASGEFGITKAMLNKCLTGKGMLGAAPCIKLPEGKAEMVVVPVTKERVPDAFIERIKRDPRQKTRPLPEWIAAGDPKARERFLVAKAHIDYLVDLEQDCLRQYKEKGYAEIGVDYTGAFKKVFILPNPEVK